MPLPGSRHYPAQATAEQNWTQGSDLAGQEQVKVACELCGFRSSRLVCSVEQIASQRAFLDWFYQSRWQEQSGATAPDRLKFTQNYSTAIVSCLGCRLLYRNPRPRSDAVFKAYQAERYDGAYLWTEFEAQRRWARAKIRTLGKHLTILGQRRPRVLEVGSFVGGFLAEACEKGWQVLGIDPGRDVTAFCRAQQLPVFEGTIEEVMLPPASYDAVVVWNTFDQLSDPHQLLKHAVRLLRNGGLFVVRVPNGGCFDWAMSLQRRLPGHFPRVLELMLAWNNLLSFPYLYGYSVEQLNRLTAEYGFRLVDCLPDQVSSTPSGQLTRWAALEERLIRVLCRLAAATLRGDRTTTFRAAPWLDFYFERACVEEERIPVSPLGDLPVYAPLAFYDTGSDCRRIRRNGEGG